MGRLVKGLGVAAMAFLAGCASQQIEAGLKSAVGQPASHLFSQLGFPDSETRIAGRKAYIWSNQSSGGDTDIDPHHDLWGVWRQAILYDHEPNLDDSVQQ